MVKSRCQKLSQDIRKIKAICESDSEKKQKNKIIKWISSLENCVLF